MAWAMVGFVVGAVSMTTVNAGSLVLVGIASVAFPACAAVSTVALAQRAAAYGGALLLLSLATPTYFALPLNPAGGNGSRCAPPRAPAYPLELAGYVSVAAAALTYRRQVPPRVRLLRRLRHGDPVVEPARQVSIDTEPNRLSTF